MQNLCTFRSLHVREIVREERWCVFPRVQGQLSLTGFNLTVLDERIDDMAEIVRLHYNLQELCDPASATEVLFFLPLIMHSR